MFRRLILASTLLIAPGCQKAHGTSPSTPQQFARRFVETLASGDTRSAMRDFSPTLAAKLSPELLEQDWKEHVRQVGAFERIVDARQEAKSGAQLVTLNCRFEKESADLWVAVDPAAGRLLGVGGFHVIAPEARTTAEARARSLVEALHRDDYAGASTDFDATMRTALPPAKLGLLWKTLQEQVGAYRTIEEVKVTAHGPNYQVLTTCDFAKKRFVVSVVMARTGTAVGQVVGLQFLPTEPCCGPSTTER